MLRMFRSWTVLPRRTLRMRLTLVYGGLFLATGAALLGLTYGLTVSNVALKVEVSGGPGTAISGSAIKETMIDGTTQPIEPMAVGGGSGTETGPISAVRLSPEKAAQVQAFQRGVQESRDAVQEQLLILSCVALVGMTFVSGALGWVVAGRVLRPLRAMAGKARQISAVNLHERLNVPGSDNELKDLGDTFDGLLGRLDAAFEAQKRFVANASHELRTPLTLQRTIIEVALSDPDANAASLREVCQRILETGADQERTIEALLTLARSQRGLDRREPVDLAELATDVVRERCNGELVPELSTGPAPILGDPRLMARLVGNLVDNAVRHNEADGWASVWTGTMRGQPTIQVANGGAVIPTELVGSLFQPFQRLEARTANRDGHGLGLSIVSAIAEAHDATVLGTANPHGGLTVTVTFPPATSDCRTPAT